MTNGPHMTLMRDPSGLQMWTHVGPVGYRPPNPHLGTLMIEEDDGQSRALWFDGSHWRTT